MTGFFGLISVKKDILNRNIDIYDIVEKSDSLIQEELQINTSSLYGKVFRNSVRKFERDRAFYENDDNLFVVDGVILNKQNLYTKYSTKKGMSNLIEEMFKADNTFFDEFRGTFSGIIFDKSKEELTVYTNHVGDKEIFYYFCKKTHTLYFASDFEIIVKLVCKYSEHRFKINNNAAYSLMTHSHVLCNETFFEDIYRLTPGHFIKYSSEKLEKHCYFSINNDVTDISEEHALEKLDTLFKQAIKRAFDKDLEYGYKHLVALSGGLDSRMTAWVAFQMGYRDMLNYTFSQTDYLDETIPKKITDRLKTEWIFKSLNNGNYIYKYFKESIKMTGARSQVCTVAHTLGMLSNINMNTYGLVHTGQLGDVVIGTFYDQGQKQRFKAGAGAYSTKFIHKVQYDNSNAFHIEDQEIFKFYNRGFTGVNAGLKPMYKYTETISPFLDIDFLEFCLTLPLKYRRGHYIYIKWINKYYPEAADFIYEKVKGKINRKIITIKGVPVPWTSVPAAAIKLIKKKLGLKLSSKNHMHPMDYWYKNNNIFKEFYELNYNQNIGRVKDPGLRADCENLFNQGSTLEKDQVITILIFMKEMEDYIR